MNSILRCEHVHKTYNPSKPNEVQALIDVNLAVMRGSFTLLRGPSGSGKTTLLSILGALERPSSGAVYIDGADLSGLSHQQLSLIRRRRIGFVFQMCHLLRGLPACENVAIPLIPEGLSERERKSRAMDLLYALGLGKRASHIPEELSGGEQQRVAVARALINDPDVLILDEPTAFIDEQASSMLMEILLKWRSRGKTILIASHDESVATHADAVYELHRGVLDGNRPDMAITCQI
jgi:putative ABC transport system ATP-binding protein